MEGGEVKHRFKPVGKSVIDPAKIADFFESDFPWHEEES
jgi:hypothetical protein